MCKRIHIRTTYPAGMMVLHIFVHQGGNLSIFDQSSESDSWCCTGCFITCRIRLNKEQENMYETPYETFSIGNTTNVSNLTFYFNRSKLADIDKFVQFRKFYVLYITCMPMGSTNRTRFAIFLEIVSRYSYNNRSRK